MGYFGKQRVFMRHSPRGRSAWDVDVRECDAVWNATVLLYNCTPGVRFQTHWSPTEGSQAVCICEAVRWVNTNWSAGAPASIA